MTPASSQAKTQSNPEIQSGYIRDLVESIDPKKSTKEMIQLRIDLLEARTMEHRLDIIAKHEAQIEKLMEDLNFKEKIEAVVEVATYINANKGKSLDDLKPEDVIVDENFRSKVESDPTLWRKILEEAKTAEVVARALSDTVSEGGDDQDFMDKLEKYGNEVFETAKSTGKKGIAMASVGLSKGKELATKTMEWIKKNPVGHVALIAGGVVLAGWLFSKLRGGSESKEKSSGWAGKAITALIAGGAIGAGFLAYKAMKGEIDDVKDAIDSAKAAAKRGAESVTEATGFVKEHTIDPIVGIATETAEELKEKYKDKPNFSAVLERYSKDWSEAVKHPSQITSEIVEAARKDNIHIAVGAAGVFLENAGEFICFTTLNTFKNTFWKALEAIRSEDVDAGDVVVEYVKGAGTFMCLGAIFGLRKGIMGAIKGAAGGLFFPAKMARLGIKGSQFAYTTAKSAEVAGRSMYFKGQKLLNLSSPQKRTEVLLNELKFWGDRALKADSKVEGHFTKGRIGKKLSNIDSKRLAVRNYVGRFKSAFDQLPDEMKATLKADGIDPTDISRDPSKVGQSIKNIRRFIEVQPGKKPEIANIRAAEITPRHWQKMKGMSKLKAREYLSKVIGTDKFKSVNKLDEAAEMLSKGKIKRPEALLNFVKEGTILKFGKLSIVFKALGAVAVVGTIAEAVNTAMKLAQAYSLKDSNPALSKEYLKQAGLGAASVGVMTSSSAVGGFLAGATGAAAAGGITSFGTAAFIYMASKASQSREDALKKPEDWARQFNDNVDEMYHAWITTDSSRVSAGEAYRVGSSTEKITGEKEISRENIVKAIIIKEMGGASPEELELAYRAVEAQIEDGLTVFGQKEARTVIQNAIIFVADHIDNPNAKPEREYFKTLEKENRENDRENNLSKIAEAKSVEEYVIYKVAEYFGYLGDPDLDTLKTSFFTEGAKSIHGIYWDGGWVLNEAGLEFDDKIDGTGKDAMKMISNSLRENREDIFESRMDSVFEGLASRSYNLGTMATEVAAVIDNAIIDYEREKGKEIVSKAA